MSCWAGPLGAGKNAIAAIRKDLADVLNLRHVSFLLGSGCSSERGDDGTELGIPTMAPLAGEFLRLTDPPHAISDKERSELFDTLRVDLQRPEFAKNLEALMEVLFGFRFALRHSHDLRLVTVLPAVESVIVRVTEFIKDTFIAGAFAAGDDTVLAIYGQFYRRLTPRCRALPRPWVFTNNHDLLNEPVMDHLGNNRGCRRRLHADDQRAWYECRWPVRPHAWDWTISPNRA